MKQIKQPLDLRLLLSVVVKGRRSGESQVCKIENHAQLLPGIDLPPNHDCSTLSEEDVQLLLESVQCELSRDWSQKKMIAWCLKPTSENVKELQKATSDAFSNALKHKSY
jgi:hypothetical protein